MARMTRGEKALLSQLNNSVDAYGGFYHADEQAAGAPLVVSKPTDPIALANQQGNPLFEAEFDLDFRKSYFTESGGTYTSILPAAVPASLQTPLPLFIFGYGDFASGFANARQKFQTGNWTMGRPFINGRDEPDAPYDAAVTADWQFGDLIIPFTGSFGGTDYVAIHRVRCASVGYATLLESLSSDRFIINAIRYVIPDTTLVAQYRNQIRVLTLSLFGKNDDNQTSPNSFKQPQQQQEGIVDIPIKVPMDKHKLVATQVNYQLLDFTWAIYVVAVNKLTA